MPLIDYGPTRVLGNWQPSQLDGASIKSGIVAEVEKLLGPFRCAYWTIREPSHIAPSSNTRWHTDGPQDIHSIVWSNILPTEFKSNLFTMSGDIILIRNLDFEHRTPFIGDGERWFVQFYEISPAKSTKLGKWFR